MRTGVPQRATQKAQVLIAIGRRLYAHDLRGLDLDQSLYVLYFTTIDLDLALSLSWGKFRKSKRPSRCTLLDLRGNISTLIRITIRLCSVVDTSMASRLQLFNFFPDEDVAQNLGRRGGSAIDGRTTRHSGYAISQKKRKRIEECFGWLKTIALMRKVRHRGVSKVHWIFTLACAAYNLVRMRNLTAAVPVA